MQNSARGSTSRPQLRDTSDTSDAIATSSTLVLCRQPAHHVMRERLRVCEDAEHTSAVIPIVAFGAPVALGLEERPSGLRSTSRDTNGQHRRPAADL